MRERIPPPEFVKNRSKNHVPKMNREPKNRVVMRFPALCTYLPVPLDDSTYTKYMDNTCSLVEFLCLLIQKSFFPQEHCLHDRRVLFPFICRMVTAKDIYIIRSLNPLAQCPSPVRESRNAVRDNVIRDERLTARPQQQGSTRHTEHVVNVRQIEECREIIKCLLRGESVLLNLENVDPKDCGRIVDLLSGAAFALQGRMIKVAHLAYLLAPQTVEVVEEQDGNAGYQGRYR